MWILRFYDPTDDEMKQAVPLRGFDREDAVSYLGFLPTRYGSTELTPDALQALKDQFGFKVPKGLIGYLDFDAPEPRETPRRTSRTKRVKIAR